MANPSETPSADRLSTGEPIRVARRRDGRFQATADIETHGAPVAHHAIGGTAEEARSLLRFYAAALYGTDPVPDPGPHRLPMTVCEIKGQGRIMQCCRPGEWPAHIPDPPAVETRCTACDGYKAKIGELNRIKARWAEWERRRDGAAG